MFDLHLPTLSLALVGGFALMVGQVALAGRGSLPRRELGIWATVCAALLISLALQALGQALPEWLLALASQGALGLGLLAMVWAVLDHLGVPLHRGRVAAAFAVYAGAMGLGLVLSRPERLSLVNGVAAACLAPLVWTLFKRGWRRGKAMRSMCLSLLALDLVLAWRAVDAWWQPAAYAAHSANGFASGAEGLSTLLAMLAIQGVAYGFVLTAQERTRRQLRLLASRDPLTGCANRRRLDQSIREALRRLTRSSEPLSFLLLDLDNFKLINDRHGHGVGDAALVHSARQLRSRLRASDLLARMGGEEFGVLLPGTGAEGARKVANAMRNALRDHPLPLPEGGALTLTASIGIVSLPAGAVADRERVYAAADAAMYEAKRAGKDRARHTDWGELAA